MTYINLITMSMIRGRIARIRIGKRNKSLGENEEIEAAGTSEIRQPIPPLNPWMKFR